MRVHKRILLIGWSPDTQGLIAQLAAVDVAVATVERDDRADDLVRSGDFDAVFVVVSEMPDWLTCGRVAAAADAPVAVVTQFIADDRRYRDFAFRVRVAAYIRPPCCRRELLTLLASLRAGQREVELIGSPDRRCATDD